MTTSASEWRPIPGYDGFYDITIEGQVRSWRSHYVGGRRDIPRQLTAGLSVKGYPRVYLSRDNISRIKLVHRLVLETFVGPAPDGAEGCHNDGDPSNCHLSNLRWDTRSGNMRDRIAHGTMQRGEEHYHARLGEADVLEISARLSGGAKMTELAQLYGVHPATIQCIKTGRTWAWLTGRGQLAV